MGIHINKTEQFSQGAWETLTKRKLYTANFNTRLNTSESEHKKGRECFQFRKGSGKTKWGYQKWAGILDFELTGCLQARAVIVTWHVMWAVPALVKNNVGISSSGGYEFLWLNAIFILNASHTHTYAFSLENMNW